MLKLIFLENYNVQFSHHSLSQQAGSGGVPFKKTFNSILCVRIPALKRRRYCYFLKKISIFKLTYFQNYQLTFCLLHQNFNRQLCFFLLLESSYSE